jgi:hypothetical protein
MQEPGDIKDSLLMLQDRRLVVEGELPEAEIAAESVSD